MKINFYIQYRTNFGQSLYITGNHDELGNDDSTKAVPLQYFDENHWLVAIDIRDSGATQLQYRYILKEKDGTCIQDGDPNRTISINKNCEETVVVDVWNSTGFAGNIFDSEAFKNVLLPNSTTGSTEQPKTCTHSFFVKAPLLQKDETVCLIGSVPGLGSWQTEKAIPLSKNGSTYSAHVSLKETDWPASYKYGIYNRREKTFVRYEQGENRLLFREPKAGTAVIIHDGFIHEPVNTWKGAGVAVPVFSLRSKNGFGTGEFADIKLLVDWAKKTGLQLIQLLPVNDTIANFTWGDSYPYAAISAFALHPLYINLERVAGKDKSILKTLRKKQKELNSQAVVNYPEVIKLKLEALQKVFDVQKHTLETDHNYQQFISQNRDWLLPYAAFCVLRDTYKTPDFHQWKRHRNYTEKSVAAMAMKGSKDYDAFTFYLWVQYHLHLQLKEAVNYAHQNQIAIKGDLPIGIYRYSCDAWINPSLYNMDEQAGAPPDDFAVTGQNWGFPTYNWQKMKETDFAWWRRRFGQMSAYFDGFRIDHILGFFRIWSIPVSQTQGIMGRFVPAIPVDISEFYYRAIPFDFDRYCLPFINDGVLEQIFHHRANEVRKKYLEPYGDGRYRLKNIVDTQAKATKALKTKADDGLLEGILQLIANVILFEEEGSDRKKFHFRFDIKATSSYQFLPDDVKEKLHHLYVDYFYRRQENFWKHEGLNKLVPLKNSTNMLVFGEDLGMVPDCVPEVMHELAILALEVERMPKSGSQEFNHTSAVPYLSVVTPSTHDMSTIRGWWQEDPGKTQHFYNYVLRHYGEAPETCEPWISCEIIQEHLDSPAMWSIFQLQDLFGIDENLRRDNPADERINVPANPDNRWNYRIHLTLENLKQENNFNEQVREMITKSGRLPIS